jgi:Flp pilus assembly pilin Flp
MIRDKMNKLIISVTNKLYLKKLSEDNSGMGVVEVILIIVVLVGLAVIFKSRITTIVNSIFSKINSKVNTF